MSTPGDIGESVRLIRESAQGIVHPGDTNRIRALRFSEGGFDHGTWSDIARMGWLGMRVPEDSGGAGLGMREYVALAEILGAGLVPEPVVLAIMAASALRGEALAAAIGGERVILPAWQEEANALGIGMQTIVGARVEGQKRFVPLAVGADAFVVAGKGGLALVDAHARGVRVKRQPTQDGGHVATVTFDRVPAEPLPGTLEAALEEATLATAAQLLGVMEQALTLTLSYLRTREQFGRRIGSFQALQHRAANMAMAAALTRASVEAAAATLDSGADPDAARAVVSRAKARACDACLSVTREAIQLHGGIGYTDEYDAGLYLRRAMVLANRFGSAALHRARFAALAPEEET